MRRRLVTDIAAFSTLVVGAAVAVWAVPSQQRQPQQQDAGEWAVQPLGVRPIAALTPGARNPEVRQSNIITTICKPGWTASIRPPTTYTQQIERELLPLYYGAGVVNHRDYAVDHLINLSLGGHPTDRRNLWPQPYSINDADGNEAGSRAKDRLERYLQRAVCAGQMRLHEAQALMADDWYSAYRQMLRELPAQLPAQTGDPFTEEPE